MNESPSKHNVLFLSSDSGGGHNAIAHAIAAGLRMRAEAQVDVLNIYQTRNLQLWPILARVRAKSQLIWRAIYQTSDRRWFIRGVWKRLLPSFTKPLFRVLRGRLLREQPDIVVAVHHASAQCLEPLASGLSRRPFTVVCVTDYDVHANWVADADLYLAASDIAVRKLQSAGKRVARLPLLPCKRPPNVARKTVSAEDAVFKILMVMGLEGSSQRKASRMIDRLLRLSGGPRIEIDVICGRNQQLHARLKRQFQHEERVGVHGFVDDIPQRMQQANLAVIRLSPQTMTEALAAGTPVVGFDWHVHESESLNVLHQFGAGSGSLAVSRTVATVKQLLDDRELRQQWYDRAYEASREAVGAELAAEWILDHAQQAFDTQKPCLQVS